MVVPDLGIVEVGNASVIGHDRFIGSVNDITGARQISFIRSTYLRDTAAAQQQAEQQSGLWSSPGACPMVTSHSGGGPAGAGDRKPFVAQNKPKRKFRETGEGQTATGRSGIFLVFVPPLRPRTKYKRGFTVYGSECM